MKKLAIIIPALVLFGGGILYLEKARQSRYEQARVMEAEQKLQETKDDAAGQKEQSARLKKELQDSYSEAAAKSAEADALKKQLAIATNSAKAEGPSPGAKLFKDPHMKEMMKKQQLQNVERTANKIVDPEFIKRLNLNPEQANYLKELLKNKYGPGAEITLEMMAGELDDGQMAELGKHFQGQMDQVDAQIKAFLGEENYKDFEWQEKSQEHRAHVQELQKKLGESDQRLNPGQEEALVRTLVEERRNFKFTVDYGDPRYYDYDHLREFFGDDNLERYYQDMLRLNDQVLQRTQTFLTPEQSAEFKAMQQDQLEKAKMVVKMTNALFGKGR